MEIVDYCVPTSLTTSSFGSGSVSYTLGRTAETTSFTGWTTIPTVCTIWYEMTIALAAADPRYGTATTFDPSSVIGFDSVTRTLTANGSDVFFGGDHSTGIYTPGVYDVEVRAWAGDPGTPTDTTSFISIEVTIVDPCDVASAIAI